MKDLQFKNDCSTHLDNTFKVNNNGVQTTHLITAIQCAEDIPANTIYLRLNTKIFTFSYEEANELSVKYMNAEDTTDWIELEPGYLVDQAAITELSVMLAVAVACNLINKEPTPRLLLVK